MTRETSVSEDQISGSKDTASGGTVFLPHTKLIFGTLITSDLTDQLIQNGPEVDIEIAEK